MGEKTGIAWTGSTWNPWRGCHKVSAGCKFCYAETLDRRFGHDFNQVRRASPATFSAPLRWKEPRRVFSCSMSDFFLEEADAWRAEAWDIIRRCPQHTFQLLTKRPERISEHLPDDWGPSGWPNVWLGTTGETHDLAFERGMYLGQVPARVHFLSAEPWLEEKVTNAVEYFYTVLNFYEWVIVGGESGVHCRPMNLQTAAALIEGCQHAHVPVFLKQLGGHPDKRSHEKAVIDGKTWTEFPKG
jgi:protein gp37